MSTNLTRKIGQHDIHIETGRFAKQADGAVTVRSGDTIVFVAAVANSKPTDKDFFPLTVEYREKAAAAGKFPGGYFKREGRPTEKEILTCRMIDRPMRPLFPKGFMNEVQIISMLLSADGDVDPDILAINGSSAALMVSDIPWKGPVGAVRVGRIQGQFVVNPTHSQMPDSTLDLVYVGTEEEILMIEGSANEISEADFFQAMEFAHVGVREMIALQRELAQKAGKAKRTPELRIPRQSILEETHKLVGERIVPGFWLISSKLEREARITQLRNEVVTVLSQKYPDISAFEIGQAFEYIQKRAVRDAIIHDGKRLDGRAADQLRAISGEVGFLPRTHGSAMFQRGETQAVVITTLGSPEDTQDMDNYGGGEDSKSFILHYNFPPFSVNETGRFGSPGRREIGHGALAERSIEPMVPNGPEFPYTIRLSSEIMESNGSTSMASVCGGTLALLDAGVPMKAPVAGISIGLVKEPEKAVLLTDIIGAEDAFGDMDFKVSGTRNGITGFQLDLKLAGLPFSLMKDALAAAHDARLRILDIMAQIIAQPRSQLSPYAPKIKVIRINPEKIGAVIGPGGKIIRKIQEETGAEIAIEDSGEVKIYCSSQEAIDRASAMIEEIVGDIEVGKTYRGRVVTIKEFGCFVEVLPGKDGMVHISELANMRVNRVEDICKVGDEMWVKCIGVDDKGRVRLSRKAAMAEKDAQAGIAPAPVSAEAASSAPPPYRERYQDRPPRERSREGFRPRRDN
ncbi:MAG: polyribonucleotide nucleotidyltransferase [Verrucomicrobia bacterium]|nr:polyribonucleotide nucleotidyltransferase [Verrucomicrobiota bacterium]